VIAFLINSCRHDLTNNRQDQAWPISRIRFTVSSKGKVTVSGTNGVTLTVTPGTGAISGHFLYPGTDKKTPFSGMIYQKPTPAGFGLFLGNEQCGELEISQ